VLSFVAVPKLFEHRPAGIATCRFRQDIGSQQTNARPRLSNASPPANIVPAIRHRQQTLLLKIVRAESLARSTMLIAPPHALQNGGNAIRRSVVRQPKAP
jgi:hypothetical protein